ncbi:MAG: hypothetical protein FWC09_06520 [Lachnospiraceae bacterium]|nr:hypothetical protein [Lachnospiraceae bacterium]
MENIELIFDKNGNNGSIKINLKQGELIIQKNFQDSLFNGITIGEIIKTINTAHKKYGKYKYNIVLILKNVNFSDKLTYIFLECICYYLLNIGHPVQIKMSVNNKINTRGIYSSPLKLLMDMGNHNKIKYLDSFKFEIYGYHYRRLISKNKEIDYFCDLYKEIDSFLKSFVNDDKSRDDVSQVVTELAGNVFEHAETDCLIDIDVAPDYKKPNDDNYYYGINIAVVNFSEKLLGDDIIKNILKGDKVKFNDRYSYVLKANNNHEKFFDKNYTENDFSIITTFQRNISGRNDKFQTGGIGLSKLIKSLGNRAEESYCYVISGKRCLKFYNDLLEYDDDGWIGFNDSNNYLDMKPKENVVTDGYIYVPGTAYNFCFIMKGERIEND